MARLLAMCLNCRKGEEPTAEPCGQCESCVSITAGSSADVIELDAASNRGIDEIRALQENVRLAPMSGRYKVYIIDEAHQMTKDAYNALLKTLEEPPPRVIFVLATTEPEKILATVRSRCQRFDFRPVPEQDIAGRLKLVAEAENIEASPQLLDLISRKADGSLRDALGLLEQCLAFAGERPSVSDFMAITGGVERDSLERLSGLVRDGRVPEAIAHLDELIRSGRDPSPICSGLIGYLRDVFLAALRSEDRTGRSESGAAPPEDDLSRAAAEWTTNRLVGFMDALARAEANMRYSPQPRLVLEMVLLGLGLRPPESRPAAACAPPESPGKISSGPDQVPSSPPGNTLGVRERAPGKQLTETPGERAAGPAPAPGAGSPTVTLEWFKDNWEPLLARVRSKSVFTRAFLLRARPVGLAGETLTLGFEVQFHKEHMEDEKHRRVFEDSIAEATGAKLRVKCTLLPGEPSAKTGAPGPDPGKPALSAPVPVSREAISPVPARNNTGEGSDPQGPVSDTMRSALTIFGGRFVDEAEPEDRS